LKVVLGIDGGGTRTRACLHAEGRILSHFEGESIKRVRVGAEAAEANLRCLLGSLFAQAGVQGAQAATVGIAGAHMPGVAAWIEAVLHDFGIPHCEVTGDEVIALDAAFHGGPGILQIAGTGSNTIGRAADGSRETSGGWGSRLGDEGSGYWIGLHSIRRALRAHDRGLPTRILDRVGALWGKSTIEELVDIGDSTPGPDFAALTPIVHALALEGDPVACAILQQAAADLVEFVLLVRDKLRQSHVITEEIPVAWTGGVLEHMHFVREAFFAGLHTAAPTMPVAQEPVNSLEGALWRAQRLAMQASV
jgi:N-acetylglucosamine kinase-like BadF-type ATPase